MRLHFAILILLTTCLTPAFAADLKSVSHVDAVTVYPSGAEITRVTEARLAAGETTLILEDLPGELDAQSIRVEGSGGEGIEIGSVDSKLVYLSSEAQDAERRRLEKEIEGLGDERQALDQTLTTRNGCCSRSPTSNWLRFPKRNPKPSMRNSSAPCLIW